MERKALYIVAHPDDELLFLGTLLKLKAKGYSLYSVVLTKGSKGGSIKVRKREEERLKQFVGVTKIFWLPGRDQRLKEGRKIIDKVVEIIRKIKPSIVISIYPKDFHKDHEVAGKIAIEACKWASKSYKGVKGEPYRVPLLLLSATYYYPIIPEVNFIVDITKVFEKKLKAIEVYQSQLDEWAKEYLKSSSLLVAHFLYKDYKGKYCEAFIIPKEFPALPCKVFADLI